METKIGSIDEILELLPTLPDKLTGIQETLLANLIMLSEIPSPTFEEEARVKLLLQRMLESELDKISTDEAGNGVGIIPGKDPSRNILLVAHADSVYSEKVDHAISVLAEEIVGPGVADNSLGMAVLATLPNILKMLGIQLNANLVLLSSTKGLGRGNLDGLRFFMDNNKIPFEAGICIEGEKLGRLSYTAEGMFRGYITCRIPEELDWQRAGQNSAIIALNEVINRILEIPIPKRPRTSIVLGAIRGGKSYNVMATHSSLRFEVRSQDAGMVQTIRERIEDIIADASSPNNAEFDFQIVSSREPGGIDISHPLVKNCRLVMEKLGVQPTIRPSMSEVSELIARGLPAVTLGITEASNLHDLNETIRIKPIYTGLAQLLAMLLAIDGGFCNEPE
ncbi:M20/M25/M40 family metallo-hydrolase [Pontiella agarivorans]|uniref:M20/M25/M40 family metallo-hydrolase n=1 Tax=Pontiella agarivorans TaxID=3038953 RepID=A0ABU5MU38_9BACT|nr:M20/M25/M40 family metallo-hydrolase [Pontiella agarivorans]MDZ8117675.1 M20/M25/M40 family metallo-hydrolase [Pontiella agarivorans]